MSRKKIVLGKNLSALLSVQDTKAEMNEEKENLLQMDVNNLIKGKYQPRRTMNEESLQELVQSIKSQGVIQPIVIRKLRENKYEILAGERRWTAAKMANLKKIPVVVKKISDQDALAIALIENLQREDLNSLEEARALDKLITEFSLTHQQAGEAVGKSRVGVSNLLRLLSLHKTVQDLLEKGNIEMGHARALLSLEHVSQIRFAKLIVEKGLTVRNIENEVRNMHIAPNSKTRFKEIPENITKYKNILINILQLPIEMKPVGKNGSKITITCKSNADVEKLLALIEQTKIA